MIFLPEQAGIVKAGLEKIETYLTLAQIGCPVFRSVLIMPDDIINQEAIDQIQSYFKVEEVTVRYQYIRACKNPIQGGNRYKLSAEALSPLQTPDTLLWILEPINRLKNEYGINLRFHDNQCIIEMVGKGFDVSDINRGQISPHEIVQTELPIRMGVYNEWWKFLHYSFCSQAAYEASQSIRIGKLSKMGYSVNTDIFARYYQPLPIDKLEELLKYITSIYNSVNKEDFCVSCSIAGGHFVFWDIQTPKGKQYIYGAR